MASINGIRVALLDPVEGTLPTIPAGYMDHASIPQITQYVQSKPGALFGVELTVVPNYDFKGHEALGVSIWIDGEFVNRIRLRADAMKGRKNDNVPAYSVFYRYTVLDEKDVSHQHQYRFGKSFLPLSREPAQENVTGTVTAVVRPILDTIDESEEPTPPIARFRFRCKIKREMIAEAGAVRRDSLSRRLAERRSYRDRRRSSAVSSLRSVLNTRRASFSVNRRADSIASNAPSGIRKSVPIPRSRRATLAVSKDSRPVLPQWDSLNQGGAHRRGSQISASGGRPARSPAIRTESQSSHPQEQSNGLNRNDMGPNRPLPNPGIRIKAEPRDDIDLNYHPVQTQNSASPNTLRSQQSEPSTDSPRPKLKIDPDEELDLMSIPHQNDRRRRSKAEMSSARRSILNRIEEMERTRPPLLDGPLEEVTAQFNDRRLLRNLRELLQEEEDELEEARERATGR